MARNRAAGEEQGSWNRHIRQLGGSVYKNGFHEVMKREAVDGAGAPDYREACIVPRIEQMRSVLSS